MPDKHDERYVKKKAIENAWSDLIKEDDQLLMKDVNERSITHKFAEHLKSQFPTWHIDCEYNRDGIDPKKVQIESRSMSSDDLKAETVYPDIVIHERCTTNNLVAIETKKDKNSSDQRNPRRHRKGQEQINYIQERFGI